MPSIVFEAVQGFINDLTDDQVTIFSTAAGLSRIVTNESFALIRRNVTTHDPISHNVQIVVKNKAGFGSTYDCLSGKCIAKVLVPVSGDMTADQVREALRASIHPEV